MSIEFSTEELLVASCFLASQIDGMYSDEEHAIIFEKIIHAGENLSKKVDHDEFFEKYNRFLFQGGHSKIEQHILLKLKSEPRNYQEKVVAYMDNITRASILPTDEDWQNSKEKELIDRFVSELNLDLEKIIEISRSL